MGMANRIMLTVKDVIAIRGSGKNITVCALLLKPERSGVEKSK